MSLAFHHRTPGWHITLMTGTLMLLVALAGCSRHADGPGGQILGPGGAQGAGSPAGAARTISQTGDTAPAGVVTVDFLGHSLHFWPYTGNSFDGTASDPINLVFVGKADPRAIRAALLALDGDRTAYGMPDAYPFNATWSDANGDVQTTYSPDGEGWVGNVVQLQLGRYELGRAHLRLFRTGAPYGDGGVWTLGGAHFEILIPGTAEHQVLSWEIARQIVVVDLMRTSLLDPDAPMMDTGAISAAPTFMEIPAVIYNGLPEDLRNLIGGPPVPVSAPVGIASDGKATILNLAQAAPIAPGTWNDAFTLTYGQLVPKPICNTSGYEYVYLSGPVSFQTSVTVDETGLLAYAASYSGRLQVTPMDPTTDPPTPTGAPYYANVSLEQDGTLSAGAASVQAMVKRIGVANRGAQISMTKLRVGTYGTDAYRASEKCLGPE
jgi:hypothetical protein